MLEWSYSWDDNSEILQSCSCHWTICFHGDSHHTKKKNMCMALLLMTDKYLNHCTNCPPFYSFSESWRTKKEHQGSLTIIKPQELLSYVQSESLKKDSFFFFFIINVNLIIPVWCKSGILCCVWRLLMVDILKIVII